MLKKLELYWTAHLQAANNSLSLLIQKPLASGITVLVIAVTLTLPALFWVCQQNASNISKHWQQEGRISLYLQKSLSTPQKQDLLQQIKNLPAVTKARLITAAEGLEMLKQQADMGDLLSYLPANPLPDVIEVTPAAVFTNPSDIQTLLESLRKLPIDQAKLDLDWVRRLHAILHLAGRSLEALMVLLVSSVIFIVGNTLRLAVYSRRQEIQVLKLLGASNSFITRPFLYSGLWYSLAGAILSILFVNLFLISIAGALQKLAQAYQIEYYVVSFSIKQAYLLALMAILLGWIGAKLAVSRQLSSIEPYN